VASPADIGPAQQDREDGGLGLSNAMWCLAKEAGCRRSNPLQRAAVTGAIQIGFKDLGLRPVALKALGEPYLPPLLCHGSRHPTLAELWVAEGDELHGNRAGPAQRPSSEPAYDGSQRR
jgi:hypothetical protein